MKVRKAIIPAAGLGTRLLPNTKSIPKEMLPLVDKPVIQYIVEEAVAAGVEEILIITNRGKNPIEDYFDYAPDLEERLIQDGKSDEAATVRAVADMADVFFLRQKETKGLGHAVWRAKTFVGDEPFAILLGDDIMLSEKPVLKQLVEAAEANDCSAVAVREVPDELITKYSSVKLIEQLSERVYKIGDMNEKPTLEEKFSNFAILGRYVLTPAIFDILEHTAPGRNNEIQLTDGMKELCLHEPMCAVDFEGRRYDTGNLKGYLEAIIDFALKNAEAGEWLRQFIIDKAENKVYVNEVNTIPGSLAFYLFEPVGISYRELIDRMVDAAKQAISSPLLETSINGARGVLINVTGSMDIGLEEVEQAATLVQQAVHPDALTIFGAAFDETLDDEIRVTVIATGFDEAQQAANAAAVQNTQTANGAPQPLNEVQGEQGQDEMDKSFDEILRIFNKDKF